MQRSHTSQSDFTMINTVSIPDSYRPAPNCLKGSVILVTGAGQGLGRIAALAYASHGATVVLVGRTVKKLEAVYDEIELAGGLQPAIFPIDYAKASQADFDAIAHTIRQTFSRLDGIFHGASHFVSSMPMSLHELPMWEQHCRINLIIPAVLTKSCLPLLQKSNASSVVFLSETHAIQPKAYWGPFAVTKGALSNLVQVWSDELEPPAGPRFNLCLPGPVASPMRAKSHPGELASSLTQPEFLESAFVYLMESASQSIRGSLLVCQSPGNPVITANK
jgi:NAD(P)-dependent dehydrogenase (short-subunit alcohol dehydrogenase family)